MDTIILEIDASLAQEYRRKYHERFQNETVKLDDSSFLRAFLEDRLREELDFLENELDES